ncbi:MAG: RNA-binding S4 domain-containing protein [Clostridiales bacterium]|nr:RNA-binding S4 domain-containing protein [Clostridiales bacterium]
MERISIKTEFIKLNQFLKWAGIAETGAHANQMIMDGLVKVNSQLETRRGRKIYDGDKVLLDNRYEFLVIREG